MNRRPIRRYAGVFLLLILLSFPTFAADIPCIWTGVERIVAIGDLHGDYEAFVSIISDPELGLVDEDLHWIAGKTHLVQLGDVMDRGLHAKAILDFLINLEKEAAEAGGMVHFLLGNHEEMNLAGIALGYPDYVSSIQFTDFLPAEYRDKKNREFLTSLPDAEREWIEGHGLDLAPGSKGDIFWQSLKNRRDRAGEEARDKYYTFISETYGPWLFTRNVVIKINSVVFVHGGINEAYSRWKIGEINDSYRRELKRISDQRRNLGRMSRSFRPRMVYQPDSPLWFRDLAELNGGMRESTVYRILDNLEARFMVFGHTIATNGGRSPVVTQESMSRFDGRVWAIDTGISSYYGGAPSAWVYDNGMITIWPADKVDLPERSAIKLDTEGLTDPEEAERYLKSASVVKVKKSDVAGRTDPWTVTLDDGKIVRKAIFKYIDRRRPDPSLLPDSFEYELAAYSLSRYLGLDIVPPVVKREIDGIPGTLQIFVENAVTESERKAKKLDPPDPEAFLTDMQVLRVFENLVLNSCGEGADTYIQEGTWKVYRVDFSECFAPRPNLIPDCELVRLTREFYRKLLDWDDLRVTDLMAPYLNPGEIKALIIRKTLILQKIERLIREKGEAAVLFE